MVTLQNQKSSLIKSALVAIAIFITSSIVMITKIDFGFLSIVTAFVLLQLFFTELRAKAIERIFGPTISAILILIVLLLCRHHYVLMFVCAIILIMLFIYYYAVGYFPYSMILGAITICLLSAMAVNENFSDAFELGFYWVANLLIGSIIVILMDWITSKYIFKKETLNQIEEKVAHENFLMICKKHLNQWRKKSHFDYKALVIAGRVALTFSILLMTNRIMHWSFIDIQAVIAGIVVSAQHSISMTHRRALMRMLGVIGGAIFALLFAYFLQCYPSLILTIILMTLSLGILTLLSERYPFWEYAFLQAGVMIPLIIITSNHTTINIHLAIERSLGSLEGGLVGIVMVYVSALLLL